MANRNTLPQINGNDLTQQELIQQTGREFGPDIQLKVEMDAIPTPTAARGAAVVASFGPGSSLGAGSGIEGFISSTSPITEVLNIVGYLCNRTRGAAAPGGAAAPDPESTIDKDNSIDIANAAHGADGNYIGAGGGRIAGTLYLDSTGAPGQQLFDLNTLEAQAPPQNPPYSIPVGIVKRTFDAAAGGGLRGYAYLGNIQNDIDVKNLMSDCIKQMINILEQTRKIFGPKGWADLYRKMKGGDGANKNHIKRTHRRHRRRYSSKQY
jgi:hypothetical protein